MRAFTVTGFWGANSLGRLGRAAAVLAWLSPGLALAQENPAPSPRGEPLRKSPLRRRSASRARRMWAFR